LPNRFFSAGNFANVNTRQTNSIFAFGNEAKNVSNCRPNFKYSTTEFGCVAAAGISNSRVFCPRRI